MQLNKIYQGRRKYLSAFLLGALANLALAPFNLLPVLLISFPMLKIILDNSSLKHAFWSGWFFGFGYFVFGLYWISNSLLVDMRFAWMIPFAIAGIPSVLAFYVAAVAWGYRKFSDKFNSFGQIILFINLWVIMEIARNYLFTGFPWNQIGYAGLNYISSIAVLGGVYLLSWTILFLSLAPLLIKTRWRGLVVIFLALTAFFELGVRFTHGIHDDPIGYPPDKIVKARIVQPNIPQTLKWDEGKQRQQLIDTLKFAAKDLEQDVIILPETAIPFHINRDGFVRQVIAQYIPDDKFLITGGLASESSSGEYKIWNSIYVLNGKGEILHRYDKQHLVPFGEYVPLRNILPVINKITPGNVDFSKGENNGFYSGNKAIPAFLPLICYEIIFPELASSEQKPQALINLTNDAWFGDSTGPHQHLAMARMRAIEQGVPVIRAANTGVSAYINSNGQIISSTNINEKDAINLDIPFYERSETIYGGIGICATLLLIVFSGFLAIFSRKK